MKSKCTLIPLALALLVPAAAVHGQTGTEIVGPLTIPDGFLGTSPPLTDLAEAYGGGAAAAAQGASPDRALSSQVPNQLLSPFDGEVLARARSGAGPQAGNDPVRQSSASQQGPQGQGAGQFFTPAPALSFEGTQDSDNPPWTVPPGFVIVPPDTEGDVGIDYYIQSNNGIFEIFDKSDGSTVLGPLGNNIFYFGTGSFCEAWNDGDPIVMYDHLADRWVFSQFALFDFDPNAGVFVSYECIAVSATNDPLGAYHLYQFEVARPLFGGFWRYADYPKLGVWDDAYYMSSNDFESVGFTNASAFAFDRSAMLAGEPATGVQFLLIPTDPACDDPDSVFVFSTQPSDLDGPAPPAGTPNTFVQVFDELTWGCGPGDRDGYQLWDFAVDWDTPGNSTLTYQGKADSPDFDSLVCSLGFGFGQCVPQPDVNQLLDTLSQFTMTPAQYRFFGSDHGGYGVMMVNGTVDADFAPFPAGGGDTGVRWAELRRSGKKDAGGWKVHQTGTYAPDDGENRWMGSVAMNGDGRIALAYSVSSENTYPSIRYTSRGRGGPKGLMTGGEQSCFEGTGSQIGSTSGGTCDPLTEQCFGGERWGDYSTIRVDPVDDCSFWLTNEYYETTSAFNWHTRICKVDLCRHAD